MKRQQQETTVETRVWSYGCVPHRVAPVKNEEAALSQMRLAQRLWNTLVAIERTRSERYKKVMADENSARILELKLKIDGAREEILRRRKAERKRTVDLGDLKADIQAWRAERNGLITIQKESQKARQEARRGELDKLSEVTKSRVKKARQAAASMGLFWGTYNDVVQRADAGRKLGELQFRGFRGQGTVTAQIMGGMSCEDAISGGNGFFAIDPKPVRKYRWARMRISSDADRKPIWLEIPIVLHRDLPKGGVIKSVSMTRRVLAGKVRWQLNVTCTVAKAVPKAKGPVIAVDIGWRVLEQGVRVAYWVDDQGKSGQVVVSLSDLDQFKKCESLGSINDKRRDEFLPKFAEWLTSKAVPREWTEKAAFLAQWRSNDRIADLIRWWADHRLPNDEGWLFLAQDWRKQYLHLANWQRNLKDQMTLRLREQYRVWAAGVARNYATLVIEQFDLREVAVKPEPEGERHQKGPASYRQIVSPSTLRGALRNACGREGVNVAALPAEWTTANCWKCGRHCEWNQAEELRHRCEHCTTGWDQDENAARNLLKEWAKSIEKPVAVGA